MSCMTVLQWFLICALLTPSIANDMHSFKMSILNGSTFQCDNTTCPPCVSLIVSNVRTCQIACLNQVLCQAASFQRSTSSCKLFADIPNQNESLSVNVDITTMVVISGTRIPKGECDGQSSTFITSAPREILMDTELWSPNVYL